MKKIAVALIAAVALAATGEAASAQGRGGSSSAGHGSSSGAGGGHSGSGWHGGSGGSGWHGGSGWSGGRHGGYWGPRVGVYIGGPAYWGAWTYPWYATYPYSYPYSYAPYPVYAPQEAPVYSEPAQAQGEWQGSQSPGPANYWYYCTDPAGYYPYVRTCSQTWMQVAPQSVPAPANQAPQ